MPTKTNKKRVRKDVVKDIVAETPKKDIRYAVLPKVNFHGDGTDITMLDKARVLYEVVEFEFVSELPFDSNAHFDMVLGLFNNGRKGKIPCDDVHALQQNAIMDCMFRNDRTIQSMGKALVKIENTLIKIKEIFRQL